MRRDYAVEADSLKPYIVPWIVAAVAGGAASGSVGAGGALTAHELNGPFHTGALARSQAPWVATDISAAVASHAALPDVHHARQHAIVGGDHTITGSALSLVGATATNTLGLIAPSSNPGTTESVLKATGGLLTLPNFTATTKVTTPHAGSPSAFTSGFTGAGYRLDDGLATAGKTTLELDEMIVRGRMRVYELLIHQIRATNGSVFVTGVGKAKTVTGSGPYTITTETDHGFAVNDLIRAQRFTGTGVYQCNMLVTAVATTLQFTATLSSGDAPAAGMEFVRLGNTTDPSRQGSIYLTADDTFAPAIDILDGVTSFAEWGAASKIKVRLGKLTSGLNANLLPSGYGIYAPNAFLSGDLLTGGGAIRIYNASGINIAQDTWGSWDNKRAVQWWPDVANMTGNPSLSIYTGKVVGGLTDQQNFSYIDANPTGNKLAGLSLTAFGQGTGGLATIYLEGGSQALTTNPSITITATTIDLVGTPVLSGTAAAQHINPKVNATYDLGTALLRWGTLYVNQIVAGSISGTTMNGAEWEYSGSMVIDANSASNTTVSVVNQGAGVASLAVEGGITSSGTSVSLVGHTHDDRYFTEAESDGRYVLKTGDTMTGDLSIIASQPSVILRYPHVSTPVYAEFAVTSWSQTASFFANVSYPDSGDPLTNMIFEVPPGPYATGAGLFRFQGNGVARGWEYYVSDVSTGIGQPAPLTRVMVLSKSLLTLSPRGVISDFYINASGDVGVGTTVPQLKFQVSGTSGYPATSGATQTGVARFRGGFANVLDVGQAGAAPWGMWLQATNNTTLSTTYPILLNPNGGDVGIGNTAPAYKLDISGTMRATGTIYAGNDIEMTGKLLAANGSVTLPSIAALADTDTGIYWPTADSVAVSAGGTQRATFGAAGVTVTGALAGSSTAAFTGAVTTPTINTASGNLSIAPAGGTTAISGSLSVTGLLSGTSWSINASGIAAMLEVTASSAVYTPTVSSGSGNLTLSPAGGTVNVVGALTGNSTAAFTTSVSSPLYTAASGDVTVSAPGGSLYLNGAATLGLRIAGSEAAVVNSERLMPAGSGLKDLGDYNRRWRTVHAEELAVQTLVAQNVIATIGGDLIVTPTTKLIADILSTAGGIGQSALYTNLTAFWRLEEATGIRYDAKGSSTLGEQGTMASTTGKVGTAASFNGSSFLYASDSATLSVGDIDFYLSGWVYIGNDTGVNRYIAFKGVDGSSSRAWALYLNGAVGAQRMRFQVWNTGMGSNATVTASTFGNLAINTWYFVEAWHNAASNQIGVAVNRTENTTAWSNGVNDDTGDFKLGARAFADYFTGALDEVGFWKNYIPGSTERNWLYNSGAGRTFNNIYLYGATDINVDVEHNNLRSGEWILLKAAPGGIQQTEKMVITSAATTITGGYRYTATRDQDGTGPNTWYIGDAVASQQKNVGEGYLWLTATSTPHGHTGPGMIGYVRTGGLVNDVKPVFVKGNLRSFVDYVSDEYGDGAGNDLTLTPTSGFKGYTIDRTNGMRLFNTDLRLYSGATKIVGLDITRGLDIELDSADGDSSRAVSYRSGGVTYSWVKGYNTGGWQYIKVASEPITGLNNAVVLRTSAAASKESSIFLSTTNAAGSTTTNYVYLHHKADGTGELELFSNTITLFGSITANGNTTINALSVGGNGVPNYGGISAGSIGIDYSPTSGNWITAGSTLLLNGLNYTTIGFHDSGSRVDFIRVGAGLITLGYDGGFGVANVAVGGTIKTSLNVPWNLGSYTAGAPAATGYVTVNVNGVNYKLLAST